MAMVTVLLTTVLFVRTWMGTQQPVGALAGTWKFI
jgi:hypothetical protein